MTEPFWMALSSLIVVIGPWKAAIVFAERTGPMTVPARRTVGIATVAISLVIALIFVLLGAPIVKFFHIDEAAFLVAAGLLVFAFAVRMVITDDDHAAHPDGDDEATPWRLAAFPLSVPLLVTPPAIATLVALSVSTETSDAQFIGLIAAVLVVMAFNLIVFLVEAQWGHLVPMQIWSVAGRVLGVLLAAFGISIVIQGIRASGLLGPV